MLKISDLKRNYPTPGKVEWLGVRPGRNQKVRSLASVQAIENYGLKDDRSASKPGGKRQVTLFQAEYLPVLHALHAQTKISYEKLRRNIAVSGINLNSLLSQKISIGQSILEITGFCHPCSKMEKEFGPGAYNALRGHGGLTAVVIQGGEIRLDDKVEVLATD